MCSVLMYFNKTEEGEETWGCLCRFMSERILLGFIPARHSDHLPSSQNCDAFLCFVGKTTNALALICRSWFNMCHQQMFSPARNCNDFHSNILHPQSLFFFQMQNSLFLSVFSPLLTINTLPSGGTARDSLNLFWKFDKCFKLVSF